MSKKSITNIAAQQFANSTVQQLDALFKTRENWEATDFKKANEGLYSLLSQCLDLFNSKFMKATNGERRALRAELTNKLTAAGVKVQANTSVLTMFVRFVFNADRKRAYGYVLVLSAAISYGIEAKDLYAFITEAGGIEEIKRREVKSPKSIANQQKVAAAMADVTAKVELASIAPQATVEIHGFNSTGAYALLLAKPQPDGSLSIVGSLSDLPESLIASLIARMAKERVKADEKSDLSGKGDQDILAFAPSASNDDQVKLAA